MGSERRELMKALGARLRGLRAEAGLTGAVLAERARVGQPTVSKVENGRMVPSADVLDRLSNALGLDGSTAREVRDLLAAVMAAPEIAKSSGEVPAGTTLDEAVRSARLVRSFQCVVLPAMLQSAEYARHVFDSAPHTTPEAVGRAVAARIEAVALRRPDCTLPDTGWGSLILEKSRPTVGKRWTGTGEVHDNRGLKNRPANETRIVPIPPRLVRMLRTHIEEFGTAKDGRLFANERGGVVASTTYWRVWDEARHLALTLEQVASPLAARPYDLRHAALSSWLNAGVDPTEVAERAGNSVEVLLSRYAKCLDGRQDVANRRIAELLGEDDGQEDEPGDGPGSRRFGRNKVSSDDVCCR